MTTTVIAVTILMRQDVVQGSSPPATAGLQADDAGATTFLQSDDAGTNTVLTTDDNP